VCCKFHIEFSPRADRRPFFTTIAFTWIAIVALACCEARAQPNIIHIIADDLGWVDLSGGSTNYGHGSDYYQTPNINALAARGMSFTSAYSQQNCVPTRASLLTGQYAPRNGIHNVGSLNRAGNDTLLVGPTDGDNVDPSAITVAETLQSAGYTTAHFGKFHVHANRADISTQHGFDINMEIGNNPSGTPYRAVLSGGQWTFGVPEFDPYAQPYTQAYVDELLVPFANGNNPNTLVGAAKHQTDAMADAVTDFLTNHSEDAAPFYVNVGFNAVHAAVTPRPDLEAKYDAIPSTDPRHTNAAYAGFVETLDQAVGRIVAAIDDPNGDGDTSDSIAANTLLLFYSDNGGHIGATDNSPLRERKGTFREGGLRVPLIATMPGAIAAGSTSDEAVHAIDFYPTFAEFANTAVPNPQSHTLDGESFAGILRGEKSVLDRSAVFWHFPGYLDTRSVPTSLITKDVGEQRYKLLYFYEDEHYELFNLTDDLSESTDLLSGVANPADYAVARQMSVDLRDWLDEQGALYPTVRATGAEVQPPAPLPSQPPVQITFDLSDPAAQGQATHQIVQSGVTLSLAAVGDGALLDRNSSGVGVNSSDDSGAVLTQRRIDGTLPTPEAIEFSFDADVTIDSMMIGAIDTGGSESLVLTYISGVNPFAGLAGYMGDYNLGAGSLTFTPPAGADTPLLVSFGGVGQDDFVVQAGTVLAITANPAAAGGILFNEISIRFFGSAQPGDYNQDGTVDAADYIVWRKVDGTQAGYDTWRENFGVTLPGSGGGSNQVPEPTCALPIIAAAMSGYVARRRVVGRHDATTVLPPITRHLRPFGIGGSRLGGF